MRCPRCDGLMVIDAYLNLEGDHNRVWIEAWRCVNCGELFDTHTLDNRSKQHRLVGRDQRAA